MAGRILGTTGIAIQKAILGCGTFGGIGGSRELIGRGLDTAASLATLDEAQALGINVLDTAERYANGESERVIGAWLSRQPSAVRDSLHIATKVAPPYVDGTGDVPFDRPFIERKLETSLQRLGVERVTFYLSHAPDDKTPIEETLTGFAAVIGAGKVGHIGCCNVSAEQLLAALDASERLGIPGFEWVQNCFNLLTPDADREVRAICRERGLGYTPFSPMAGGVLTGKYKRGQPFPEGSRMALRPEGFDEKMTDAVFTALEALQAEAGHRGVGSGSLALAWIMAHPDCTAPVVGPSRQAPHLGHVADAMKVSLTPEEHARLTAVFDQTSS